MLTLGIYNSLTKLYDGEYYKIGGTGTIEWNGNVNSIGGEYSKLMTAYQNDIKVIMVPKKDEENFMFALNDLGLKGKINVVPISNIDEAINYINDLFGPNGVMSI